MFSARIEQSSKKSPKLSLRMPFRVVFLILGFHVCKNYPEAEFVNKVI